MNGVMNLLHQRGTALIMALVVLLLLTILGLSAMNTTVLEEKMASNAKDKLLAFEAAESALLHAEGWLALNASTAVFPDAANGLYTPNVCPGSSTAGATPVWDCVVWTGTANLVIYPNLPGSTSAQPMLGNVSAQPKYIIELLNTTATTPQRRRFRVTAYGNGSSSNSVAMVQSIVEITL